ncbi:hypothetical protein KOW79_018384 [Hemibagrus wyckioides]|uniref:Uncharacterized protein n=1 Tax=Hemibagrus wyckioides TaxID=337641 RepID=A0A9D3NC07_9TELE|nr:hypothetical protein KOW79_018384 [Hemibagrus wyckioides]
MTFFGGNLQRQEVSDSDSVNYAALQFSKKKTKRNKRHDVEVYTHVVYVSVSDSDSVNYAALQFSKKKTKRNKRHEVKEDPHVVYSSVGQRIMSHI